MKGRIIPEQGSSIEQFIQVGQLGSRKGIGCGVIFPKADSIHKDKKKVHEVGL